VAERLGAGDDKKAAADKIAGPRTRQNDSPTPSNVVKRSDIKPGERIAVSNDGSKRMVNRGGKWLPVID
jgi:hypothetical protein